VTTVDDPLLSVISISQPKSKVYSIIKVLCGVGCLIW